MDISEKIKELRLESGLSLQKFANILNITDTAVLKWEQGKTEPKASNLRAIALNFDVDLNEFLEIDRNNFHKNIKISNSFNGNNNKNKITF